MCAFGISVIGSCWVPLLWLIVCRGLSVEGELGLAAAEAVEQLIHRL